MLNYQRVSTLGDGDGEIWRERERYHENIIGIYFD